MIEYHLFRHVTSPKREPRNDMTADFYRRVDHVGITQGLGLGKRIATSVIRPCLILRSPSPRVKTTAMLACRDFLSVPTHTIDAIWPIGKRPFVDQIWAKAVEHNRDTAAYLRDEQSLALYKAYGNDVAKEVQRVVRQNRTNVEHVFIFGHSVWNCFIAWALAGFPDFKDPFFVDLGECDELVVRGTSVTHVPFVQ